VLFNDAVHKVVGGMVETGNKRSTRRKGLGPEPGLPKLGAGE